MKLLPRLYYEKSTGNYICLTDYTSWVKQLPNNPKEYDMNRYEPLKKLNADAIECIQLGENNYPYTNEFMTGHCIGVDLKTKELLFDYTEKEQEQLQELKTREQLTQDMQYIQQQLSALGKVIVQSKLKEGETA